MNGKCFGLVRGRVMRVTRLDGCGRVDSGACTTIVSDGFVSIAVTSRVTEGEAIELVNAAGKKCVSDTPPPTFDGFGIEITFCKVDPMLYSMLTGQSVVYDAEGIAVGFRANSKVDASKSGVAIEVWSDVPSEACDPNDPNAAGSWGYQLFPFLQGGVIGDYTIENAGITFSVRGMVTKGGTPWGTGTFDVVPGVGGVAGPLLEPLDNDDHFHMQLTSIAPPEPGCTCMASGPEPTTATAGTPGTWGPVDSYPLETLAALQGSDVAASPTAAWGSGEYIVLGDGSHAHWTGTAWASGAAS